MLNTCSIGRRWKSREGWSRPVLTGERGTLFPTLAGRVSSCGGFLVGWQGTLFLVVTTTMLVRRFACVRCPVPGPPRPESVVWLVPLPADPGWGLVVHSGFAVVMAQVRRPVPFRTRKLRPGTAMVLHSRGCGRVARRRIQLSGPSGRVPCGIPGRSLFIFPLGVPGALRPAGTPIFYAFFRCSLPVACGRLPFHNTPRITWSASVTVINDVMRLTRYVRAGSRESRYDGKRHKPDD